MIKNQATLEKKLPAHELVYRQLRDLILFGELAPGQAVTIQGLTEQLGAGMTPVREAIRRLIAEEALDFQGNRRVSVPDLTPQDLDQLIHLRLAVEPELTALACAHVTPDQIAELAAMDTALDAAITAGDVGGYLRENHNFHTTLYDLAGAPILAGTTQRLWLRFGPALRVVCGRFGTQSLRDFHKDILDALQAGDPASAAEAMAQDVQQGMNQVREAIALQHD